MSSPTVCLDADTWPPILPYECTWGELFPCDDPDVVNGITELQAYCAANPAPEWKDGQDDIRAALIRSPFPSSLAYGDRISPHTRDIVSEHPFIHRQYYPDGPVTDHAETGAGFIQVQGGQAYGDRIIPVVPIGCMTMAGWDGYPDGTGIKPIHSASQAVDPRTGDPWNRMARMAKLRVYPKPGASAYGPQILMHGGGPCNTDTGLDGGGDPIYRWKDPEDNFPMYGSHFETECQFCPVMFWTVQRPCLTCSYDDRDFDALCPGKPDHDSSMWMPTADGGEYVNVGGAECSEHDDDCNDPCGQDCSRRRLLGFLAGRILTKSKAWERIPMKPMASPSCGKYGWELYAKSSRGIRINPDWVDLDELPAPETFWHSCGPILPCDEITWCGPAYAVQWDWANTKNRIESAEVYYTQHERCEAQLCEENPMDNLGTQDPRNPATDLVTMIHCKIVYKLMIWTLDGTDPEACCDCSLDQPPSGCSHSLLREVTITGQYDGPWPWGEASRANWSGYPIGPPYPGMNGDRPDGAYPRMDCGQYFVHQGEYGDGFGTLPPPDSVPKRCPSWILDDTSASRFWCPPPLLWTWNQGNDYDYGRQCWAVENATNSGCLSDRNPGCLNPNCRRGCAMRDDTWLPTGPCEVFPFQLHLRPWGCEQCHELRVPPWGDIWN